MTSQTFYGLSLHWAQYCGMYDITCLESPRIPYDHDTLEVKLHAWRLWLAKETHLRTLLGLCIVDGVASQFSGNLVNTRQATSSLPISAGEEAFSAETVDEWIRCMGSHQTRSVRFCDLCDSLLGTGPNLVEYDLALFDLRVTLEIMSSLAAESFKAMPAAVRTRPKLQILQALTSIRQHILRNEHFTSLDKSIGLLRWHAVCLDMAVSSARGARRMCEQHNITQNIFGGVKRKEHDVDPNRWTRGSPAHKCLLHALQIQKIASQMPLGVAHDVYLPGALFAAASTYSSFALNGVSKILIPNSIDWDTVLFLGLDDQLASVHPTENEGTHNTLMFLAADYDSLGAGCEMRNLSYELSSIRILLRGLSLQWGVTQEMERVVEAWAARCD